MYGKIRWPLITTNWIPIYADRTNYSNDYGQQQAVNVYTVARTAVLDTSSIKMDNVCM
jgi:hypothetical protein